MCSGSVNFVISLFVSFAFIIWLRVFSNVNGYVYLLFEILKCAYDVEKLEIESKFLFLFPPKNKKRILTQIHGAKEKDLIENVIERILCGCGGRHSDI